MNKEEAKVGTKVIYSLGTKGSLFGHKGVIMTSLDMDGLVMVAFEDGNTYPCYYNNLDKLE